MAYITLPLPFQIANGQIEDAAPVMGNFNYIAAQVNANIPIVSATDTNTFWGYGALQNVTPNSFNTAFGYNAGAHITGITTNGNTAIGINAMAALTNTGPNVALGENAMQLSTGCRYITALGTGALNQVTGNENTGVGNGAGSTVSSGINNTLIGSGAGTGTGTNAVTTGSNNTCVGRAATVSALAAANRTAIGAAANCTADNTVQLGSTAVTNVTAGAAGGASLGSVALPLKGTYLDFTNTLIVGDVAINKPSGRVNLGAGTSSMTVSNALVTDATAHIFLQVHQATPDATANHFSVVAGSGAFLIQANAAATADVAIDFFVLPTT